VLQADFITFAKATSSFITPSSIVPGAILVSLKEVRAKPTRFFFKLYNF